MREVPKTPAYLSSDVLTEFEKLRLAIAMEQDQHGQPYFDRDDIERLSRYLFFDASKCVLETIKNIHRE